MATTSQQVSYVRCAPQGSSAIQIVPALAKHAKQLDNYVRGSTWIATPFASEELVKRKPDAGNVAFTEEEKDRWANDAEEYMAFRKNMEREVRHLFFAVPPRSSTDSIPYLSSTVCMRSPFRAPSSRPAPCRCSEN